MAFKKKRAKPAFVLFKLEDVVVSGNSAAVGNVGSISKTPLELQVLELCDRVFSGLGFRVVDLDCRIGGHSLVRIFIERASSECPSIDDCALASRTIGDALDAADLIPSGYDLEVSSPGVDRRLRLETDFERVLGSELKVKLTENLTGAGVNLSGTLEGIESGSLKLKVPGAKEKDVVIPLAKVKQANVVWQAKQ